MIEQGTAEWHALRCGRVTASRIADVMARTKSGWGASRDNYMAEIIAERLTGQPAEKFQSAAMKWGSETEAQAKAAYEFYGGEAIENIGFVEHPIIAMSGASPDGLVGDRGLIEIKCPNTSTHINTLLGAVIDNRYRLQMQWQMACTGRLWCDFVSFDPRMPEDMRCHVQRVPRDNDVIMDLEIEIPLFLAEVAFKVDALIKNYRTVKVKEAAE